MAAEAVEIARSGGRKFCCCHHMDILHLLHEAGPLVEASPVVEAGAVASLNGSLDRRQGEVVDEEYQHVLQKPMEACAAVVGWSGKSGCPGGLFDVPDGGG